MYFYEIEVYHSLLGSEKKIVMGHDACFDNHQLNIIVQEAFDECIEKYCNKSLLDKGEEACRMEVETIFEKHLPLQLKNHGFKSIKINATCSIQSGVLFGDDGATNLILKGRYKDKILPPCRKCMRETYFDYNGKCVVPNTRKDNSLPTTRVVKTIPIDLKNEKEENKDDFNISILKQYFINFKKSIGKIKIAIVALDDFFFNSYDCDNVWIDRDVKVGSEHEGDIFCGFDLDTDKGEFKKLLEDYGFVLEDDEDGFWIIGVKK